MNRIVLRQNNTSGNKTLLNQDMFCRLDGDKRIPYTNTIFVIQNDFELAENITIPTGCVLEFSGGSINNGKINTNGCYIDAGLYKIFNNIEFNVINQYNGSLEVIDNIYLKVKKANSFVNKKTNRIVPANTVINRRYTYRITGKSTSPRIGKGAVTVTINGQTYTIAEVTSDNKYRLKYDYSRILGTINATGEMASGIFKSLNGITFYAIEPLSYSTNSMVANKEIHPEWFGAKGDNKTDDSFAFNSALDLAYYSDSKVIIGNGVYKINDALIIHTHTNLVGIVPTVEHPVKGCFSVNTDVAMLVFDQYNPSGGYILENFGFIPFSNANRSNYTGIKIYHSQNHARISNVGFYYPKTGIEIDALGGVQLLRCEDISLWGEEKKEIIALSSRFRLGGWFNANYFRPAFIARSTVIKSEGGGDNTLDGGSCETNSFGDYLIDLDKKATLIVRGGLYKETGRIAKLRNSSKLIIEGDGYLYGNIDCDITSQVINASRNIQSRQRIINNSVSYNDVVIAHYQVFSKNTNLWHETIENKIIKPIKLASNYTPYRYNGRIFTSGECKLPMGDIDINGKTIVLRVISPSSFNSLVRRFPLTYNDNYLQPDRYRPTLYSQARSQENTSSLYAPGEMKVGLIEKGEQFVFLNSKEEKYILHTITSDGNPSFLISDIYIINKDSKDIDGNEELRIIDIMLSLDAYVQNDGLLMGYNKGPSRERPTTLTSKDEGFEYFDTTLHKPVYWTGDTSIGDNGWVDALGKHPNL